jgi:hypothetical protein
MIVAGFINVCVCVCVCNREREGDRASCSDSLWNNVEVRSFYHVNYNIYYNIHLPVRQHSDCTSENISTQL